MKHYYVIELNPITHRKTEKPLEYYDCFIEDGSVDADSLAADGVAPGSVVVYRQGTVEPQLVFDNTVGVGYNSILSDCLEQMRQITANFVEVKK